MEDKEPDAFRHCVWSAFMTERSNAGFAQRFGNAHEYGNTKQTQRAENMDLHNNGWGRHVGLVREGDDDYYMAFDCWMTRESKLWWFGHGV